MKSFAFLPAVLAAFLTPASLPASLILWQGNASASWSNGANWVGGTAPADNTTADQAGFVFPALPAHEPNAGTRQANGIVIGDGTTAMPAFEISGTRITLGDSGILQNPGASNTTITAILELAGNQTWVNNSAGILLLADRIDNNGFALTLDGNGTIRSTGRIDGTGALAKDGTGTLLLEGTNTYEGTTFVSGGKVVISTVENLGRRGTGRILEFNNGGTLQTTANMTFNTRIFEMGDPDLDGTAGRFDVDSSTTTTIAATVRDAAGAGALEKLGNGTLVLQGNNTFTGGAIISGGTLRAGEGGRRQTLGADTSSVTFNGTGATLELAGTIGDDPRGWIFNDTGTIDTNGFDLGINGSTSGAGGLVKTGSGTLTVNTTASHEGGTTVRAGELVFESSAIVTHPEGDLVVGDQDGDSAAALISGADLETNWAILGNAPNSTGNATMTSGSWLVKGNFFVGYQGDGILSLSGGNVTVDFYQFHVGSEGNGTFLMSGGNFTNSNAFIGDALGSTGNATITGGRWTNTMNLAVGNDGTANLAISGNGVVAVGNTLSRGVDGTITLAPGGTLEIGLGGTTGTLDTDLTNDGHLVFNRSTNSTHSKTLSGSGNFSQNGSAKLTLTANSTYTGNTAINSGILEIASTGRLGSGSYSGTISNNGSLIHSATVNQTLSGSITGSGSLTKSGLGALTLSGNNSHSGGTILADGQLNIDNNNALGSGAFTITGGSIDSTTAGITLSAIPQNWNADFAFAGTNDLSLGTGPVSLNATRTVSISNGNLTVGGSISGLGFGLTKNGSGTLILSGSSSYSGNTTVNAGTLVLATPNAIAGTSNLAVNGGSFDLQGNNQSLGSISGVGFINLGSGTLTTNSTNNSSFSGSLTGSGSLIKSGPGALTLSGINSYSGNTAVTAGTLAVTGSIANSTVTASGGGTLAGTGAVGKTIISSGGRIAPGNSPGILDTGDITLAGGGGYNWEIASVSGTPGTDWDLVRAGGGSGNATITATPSDRFTIFVEGNPTGWNPVLSYSWGIIDWGIATGFDANAFTVDLSGFSGAAPIGVWSLANTGGFLTLDYLVGDPEWSGGSGNWSTGFVPPLTDGAPIAFTGPGGNSTNDIPAATISSIGELVFAPSAGAYTLAANPGSSGHGAATPLTLGGNVTNNSTATQTLGLALDIPGTRTFQTSPGNLTLPGPVSGAGTIVKTGSGSLLVQSDIALGGNIEVQQGLLTLNGNSTLTELAVLAGARLGGTGTINGNLVNRGTVAPGNSIGTLATATFTQAPTGSLEIEVAGPASFDRLVVGGLASLAGTLDIVPIGGAALAFGQSYAFLQAGSISGAFDTINTPAGFRGRFVENGTTGTLLVAPSSYTQAAATPNQNSVAAALDTFIPATTGDRLAVSTALDGLTAAEFPAAFEQIGPGFYENLADLSIEQAFVQAQLLAQRLGSLRAGVGTFQTIGMPEQPLRHDINGTPVGDFGIPAPGGGTPNWSAWVLGSGSFTQAAGYRNDAGGFLAGADHAWGGNFSTGLYAGYQYNEATPFGGSIRGNSVLFGTYGTVSHSGYYADAIIGGAYTNYQTRRPIAFGDIDRTARAQPGSGQFTTALNLGKDWNLGAFTAGPILGAQYTYAGIGGFAESGADSLDLSLGQQDANSFRTTLGGRIAYTWNPGQNLALIPEVRMLWLHEFLDGPRTLNAALDGGSGSAFGFDTANPNRNSAFAGAGLNMRLGQTWTASAFYNVDFGAPDFTNNIISLALSWNF